MFRAFKPNTYKAPMSFVNSEFYDFKGAEDEAAAFLLATTFKKLVKRAPQKLHVQTENTENQIPKMNTPIIPKIQNLNSAFPVVGQTCLANIKPTPIDHSKLQSLNALISLLNFQSHLMLKKSSSSDLLKLEPHKAHEKIERKGVILPKDMVPRLVRDVIRMSEGEKGGIRGCCVILELKDGEKKVRLGKVIIDPKVPTSCELYLCLVRVSPPKPTDNKNVPLFGFMHLKHEDSIFIGPGYTLEKKRLATKKKTKSKKQVTFQLD